jgi:hypothetical protein
MNLARGRRDVRPWPACGPRRLRRGIAGCVLLVVAGVSVAAHPQQDSRPLPDRDTFLRNVRQHLRTDDAFPGQYTFIEHQHQVDYDAHGRPGKRTDNVYEVYPSVEGSPAYRRHVSTNGIPVPREKLADADRKHRAELLDWSRDRARETAAQREKRTQKEVRARQEGERTADEIFRLFDIRLVGRTTIRERPAIELSLTPRPGVKTSVKGLSVLQKVKARAWIDEQDYQVVRLEAETIDTIRVALGLLAKVDKGTTASFERQRNGDGAWLPSRATMRVVGRVALFKRLNREEITEFRDYRKFTVDSSVTFTLPKWAGS